VEDVVLPPPRVSDDSRSTTDSDQVVDNLSDLDIVIPHFEPMEEALTLQQQQQQQQRVVSPRAQSYSVEEVAEYINLDKLMKSSDYHPQVDRVSGKRSNPKQNSASATPTFSLLDGSGHTKSSWLEERSRSSSYRGPKTKMQGIMKCRTTAGTMSLDSSLQSLSGHGTDDTPPSTKQAACSFSVVNIREHERIAGDNPCVSKGVPLSIGWGYVQHQSIELDYYEKNKGPSRDKVELLVPPEIRLRMLKDEFGVSTDKINAAVKEVSITKRQRRHTVATEHLEGWTNVLQSAYRKFSRLVKATTSAKEQEKLWEKAHKKAMREQLLTHGADSLGKNPEKAGVGSINQGPTIVAAENGKSI
jgi:hypothetical protein